MAKYFMSRGDQGNLQIDDEFLSVALVKKETVVIPASAASRGSEITYTVTSDTVPIIALRPVNTNVNIYVVDFTLISTNTYRIRLAIFNTTTAQPVVLYIFGRASETSSTYGRKLFDANGRIVFDSNWKFLRTVKFISGIPENDVTTNENGKILAAVITSPNIETQVDVGMHELGTGWFFTDTKQYASVIKRTATAIVIAKDFYSWSYVEDSQTCSGGFPDQNDDCVYSIIEERSGYFGSVGNGILIVDVTNY